MAAASGLGVAAAGAAALLTAAAAAQTVPDVTITELGEYVVQRETGTLEPTFNPSGKTIKTDEFQFVARTTVIEARLCRRFGIRFIAPNLDPVFTTRVTIRIRHPMLAEPGGAATREHSWEAAMNGSVPNGAGYAFTEPWELVPGRWTFSVMFGGMILAEQAFDVVAPAEPGTLPTGGCNAPVS